MATQSASFAPDPQIRLQIASEAELREFLRDILLEFLQVFDLQPRLLDQLMAYDWFTDSDRGSVSGGESLTNKHKIRKFWCLLNKMPVQMFMKEVAPKLVRWYPHIIPLKYTNQQDDTEHVVDDNASRRGGSIRSQPSLQMPLMKQYDPALDTTHKHHQSASERMEEEEVSCVHHAIKHSRIRFLSFADVLYHHRCLDFDKYLMIISGVFDHSRIWDQLFSLCRGHTEDQTSALSGTVQALMNRYKLHVPPSLDFQLSCGLPCRCPLQGQQACMNPEQKRNVCNWLEDVQAARAQQMHRSSTSIIFPDSRWDDFSSLRDENFSDEVSIHSDASISSYSVAAQRGLRNTEGSKTYQKRPQKGPSLDDADPQLRAWASSTGLTDQILLVLVEQGFTSIDNLASYSPQEVTEVLQQMKLLTAKQCLDLKKALTRLMQPVDSLADIHIPYIWASTFPPPTTAKHASFQNNPSRFTQIIPSTFTRSSLPAVCPSELDLSFPLHHKTETDNFPVPM